MIKYFVILYSIMTFNCLAQDSQDSLVLLSQTDDLIEYYKPNYPKIEIKLALSSEFNGILDGVYLAEDNYPYGRIENGQIIIYDRFYQTIEKFQFLDSSLVLREEFCNEKIKSTEKYLPNGKTIATNYSLDNLQKQILISNDTSEVRVQWYPNGELEYYGLHEYQTSFDSCIYFNQKGLYTYSIVNGLTYPSTHTYLDRKESHSYRVQTLDIYKNHIISGAGKEGGNENWIWDLAERKLIDSLIFPKHPINSLKFSPNGLYIGAGYGGYNGSGIVIWNSKDRNHLATFNENNHSVYSIDFSPDSRYLITGGGTKSQAELLLWDIKNESLIVKFNCQTDVIVSVDFSNDDNLFASVSNFIGRSEVILWDYKTHQKVKTLTGNTYPINQIKFDDNQSNLISVGGSNLNGFNSEINIWDYVSGRIQRRIEGCKYEIQCFAISQDSKYLVTGGGYYDKPELILWNYETGEIIKKLSGHMDVISCVSFSNDGKKFITGSWDGRTIIWDIEKILNEK